MFVDISEFSFSELSNSLQFLFRASKILVKEPTNSISLKEYRQFEHIYDSVVLVYFVH